MTPTAKAPETPKGLTAKLAAAISEVEHVAKDGTNEHFKYRYTSAEEVYREIRKPLLSRGLIVIPSAPDITVDGNSTTLKLKLRLIDSESGEELEAEWFGEGQDSGDKGPYKAATGGMKTWLRHLFLLPADDDPEADARTDKEPSKPATKKGKPTTKQLEFFESLAKEAGFGAESEPPMSMLMAWASTELTGGKEGTCSDAINGLKEKSTRTEYADRLGKAAAAWAAGQSEVPADTTDLPNPADAETLL